MLHQIFNSPFQSSDLMDALSVAEPGDSLVCLQDAVYASISPEWLQRLSAYQVYWRALDLQARHLQPQFGQTISDSEWVELIAELGSPFSWLP